MALKKVFHFYDVFNVFEYPAGEPHIKLQPEFLEAKNGWFRPFIVSLAYDWNDLMLVRIGNQILMDNEIRATFVIPYLPFARHDRKNDHLDSLPLKFVAEVLDGLHIITVDPHSDVAGVFPHYSQAEVVKLFEAQTHLFTKNAMVAIPDAGATKKAYSWLAGRDVVQCLKTRNPKTGALSGFEVVNPEMVRGRHVVIVDDICDGGGTFLGLADMLLGHAPKSLSLCVTHGLFTKGLDALFAKFDGIYTLDTYKNAGPVTTVPIEDLIMQGAYF